MAAVGELIPANQSLSDAEDNGEPEPVAGVLTPSFPTGRVKRIMRLDADINKVSSEAVLMISLCSELFIEFLAERSWNAAAEKRRKTIKLEDLRKAIKGHSPTADFLFDCLPKISKLPTPQTVKRSDPEKPLPAGVRRIDAFFSSKTPEEIAP
ncbi:nuclear transcription factor Y subunit C-9 [Phalaenopsis equestris]|uniref:nuclear transcription factor Y subunit C-9 n=1 Tax=Phalaenopsis equestris TaxID=78828 RepID=UPI0009E1EB7F|nr:nuclear transcription factor Y subunit C-9 [Phalaenopsis equestris]